MCWFLQLYFIIQIQDDIERFKLKEDRNKFKKAVPPSKKRKYDEDSDESGSDVTGSSDDDDDDHEPEVKQRKVAAPKQQLAELSDDDDVQVQIERSFLEIFLFKSECLFREWQCVFT